MKARTPTPRLAGHVNELWDARLAANAVPGEINSEMSAEAPGWPPTAPDPFNEAGRIALQLHGMMEMPGKGARQSRAALEVLAMMALRDVE